MKLKQTISLIIVIIALVGAGLFGYLTITGKSSPVTITTTTTPQEILPEGTRLDFDPVNEFNKNQKLFRYPEVTESEIGVGLNDAMLRVQPQAAQ